MTDAGRGKLEGLEGRLLDGEKGVKIRMKRRGAGRQVQNQAGCARRSGHGTLLHSTGFLMGVLCCGAVMRCRGFLLDGYTLQSAGGGYMRLENGKVLWARK